MADGSPNFAGRVTCSLRVPDDVPSWVWDLVTIVFRVFLWLQRYTRESLGPAYQFAWCGQWKLRLDDKIVAAFEEAQEQDDYGNY